MKAVRSLAVGLWAASALLIGHAITYLVVYPDSAERAEVLHHTGHGWMGLLGPAAVLFVVGATVATLLSAFGDRGGRRRAFAAHASTQVLAYVLLEVGERAAHAGSWETFRCEVFSHRSWLVLVVGIGVQVLCSLAASLLARAVGRLVRLRSHPTNECREKVVERVESAVDAAWTARARVRGPPWWRVAPSTLVNVACR